MFHHLMPLLIVATAVGAAKDLRCMTYSEDSQTQLLPNAQDCRKFFMCDLGGNAQEMPCPAGLYFSPKELACSYDSRPCVNGEVDQLPSPPLPKPSRHPTKLPVGSVDRHGPISSAPLIPVPEPKPQPAPIVPPVKPVDNPAKPSTIVCEGSDPGSAIPIVGDCRSYLICLQVGVAVNMRCPVGLHFSVDSSKCEDQDLVFCQDSNQHKPLFSVADKAALNFVPLLPYGELVSSGNVAQQPRTPGGLTVVRPETESDVDTLPLQVKPAPIPPQVPQELIQIKPAPMQPQEPVAIKPVPVVPPQAPVVKPAPQQPSYNPVQPIVPEPPKLELAPLVEPQLSEIPAPLPLEIMQYFNKPQEVAQVKPPQEPRVPEMEPQSTQPKPVVSVPILSKPQKAPERAMRYHHNHHRCVAKSNWNDAPEIPHDTDCSKYLVCVGRTAIEKDCPPGQHWSVHHNWCDYPFRAQCKL